MAGRGTDIVLGGNINFDIQKKLYDILTLSRNYSSSKKINAFKSIFKKQFRYNSHRFLSVLGSLLMNSNFLKLSDIDILRILKQNEKTLIPTLPYQCSIQFLINELINYSKKNHKQENKIVKNLGGLYVIGTERNKSCRVDNQLRGRCGRQGDPGISRFFLSLDDNLLRLFGGPKIQNFMQNQMLDNEPLEAGFLTKSLDSAQMRVEEQAYQQRKNLFDYDDILNKQRNIIYFERRQLLKSVSVRKNFLAYGEQVIIDILLELKNKDFLTKNHILLLEHLFGKKSLINQNKNLKIFLEKFNLIELKTYLFNEFWLIYQTKRNTWKIYGDGISENLEQTLILNNLDQIWQEHLQKMTLLREAVSWRSYGQRNPLYEYKREAFKSFKKQKKLLRQLIIFKLLRYSVL